MSDLEWEFIKAVLPSKSRGVKRVDDRRVINGIFYVLRTGIPWADLPEQYGPCLIPWFDGAILSKELKEALWDKFVTGAPRPRTPSELQYSDRKLRSRC